MSDEVVTLGVVQSSYVVNDDERVGWLRHRDVTRAVTYLDWTVDGRPLREHVPYADGRIPDDVTVLQNDGTASGVGHASLRALLDVVGRTEFDVRMPDGRPALLFCRCFDLGCGALTAEVVATSRGTVEWRDIAWQVPYRPLDLAASEFDPPTFAFDAGQYRGLVRRLLVGECAWAASGAESVPGR